MLDIKRIREDYEGVKKAVELRGKGDFGLSNVVELLLIVVVYNRAYGVLLYGSTVRVVVLQLLLLVIALLCIAYIGNDVVRYPAVIAMVALSAFFAWRKLH